MKISLAMAVVVAVTSALVTVGAIELLRASPERSESAAAERALEAHEWPAPAPRAPEPLVPAPRSPDASTGLEGRLAELERRLAALELGSSSRQAAVGASTDEPPPPDDLRELVLGWVAEEREARRRGEEVEAEKVRLSEIEFDARYQALMLAQEHGLSKWQEDEFAELFLATRMRADEIEKSIDPHGDPQEVEARWAEFDRWVDERERELTTRLDPALYDKIYGDD